MRSILKTWEGGDYSSAEWADSEALDVALQDFAPDATLDWSHSRGPNAGV